MKSLCKGYWVIKEYLDGKSCSCLFSIFHSGVEGDLTISFLLSPSRAPIACTKTAHYTDFQCGGMRQSVP